MARQISCYLYLERGKVNPQAIFADDQFEAAMREKILESAQTFLSDPNLKDYQSVPTSFIYASLLGTYEAAFGALAVAPFIPMIEMAAYLTGQKIKEIRNV